MVSVTFEVFLVGNGMVCSIIDVLIGTSTLEPSEKVSLAALAELATGAASRLADSLASYM